MDERRVLIQCGEQRQVFLLDDKFMFNVTKVFKIENSDIIFQEYDEDWQEYIDIKDLGEVKDKAKLRLVLKENKQDHNKVITWQESPAGKSSASSLSTLSVDTDLSELSDEEVLPRPSKQAKHPIQSEEPRLPDGLPIDFQLPRHFGRKIDGALRVGDVDNKVRNAVVRTVATCVSAVVKKPTPSMCEFLAKDLIQKYPCLRERDPRDYLKAAGVKVPNDGKPFKNWMILKRQLQRKFENMKSASHPKKEENAESSSSAQDEDAEPDGEVYDDPVTTQRNISKLKAEMSKAKWNTKTVTELLKSTFTERRKAMQKFDAGSRIKKTLECYRCLSHQVEFEVELLTCLKKTYDIDLTIEDMITTWNRLVDPILEMAQKVKILRTLEEDPDRKEMVALQCLPLLFRLQNVTNTEAGKHLIVLVENGDSIEAAKENAPTSSPFLLFYQGKQVILMQNNKTQFMEISDAVGVARGVICLLGIYYIFHLEYPSPARGAFLFLQEHVFHHFLSRRPLRYATRLAELRLPTV